MCMYVCVYSACICTYIYKSIKEFLTCVSCSVTHCILCIHEHNLMDTFFAVNFLRDMFLPYRMGEDGSHKKGNYLH